MIAYSLEDDRSQISIDEENNYIDDIEELMLDPSNPYLLINFDETGCERKPDKHKKKKSLYFQKQKKTFFSRNK